jgi:hypothetical protein
MTRMEFRQIVTHPQCLRALSAFASALAAAVLVAALFWRPALVGAAEAEAALATTRSDLRAYENAIRLAGDYAIRIQQADAIETKLSQGKGEPEFIRDVEALAVRSGAALTQFSSHKSQAGGAGPGNGPGKGNGGVRSTTFEFFMSGSYADLKKFVVSLKELNEFVSIERAVFEHGEQTVKAHLVVERRQRVE